MERSRRAKRDWPLPPPLRGTEGDKDLWVRELEITRADLDEMSPADFSKAWDARNARLETAGVFEHISELWDKYGEAGIDRMTPTELIEAVKEFRGPT
jgi:hypothetical protein